MEILEKKKTKHMYSSCSNPRRIIEEEDVMIEIFLWLPVKSLIRFKSLSKRWHFLISHKDSFFRSDYLNNITTRGSKRLVGSYDHSPPPSMAGFFFQLSCVGPCYKGIRFVPTSTEFKFVKKENKRNPPPFLFLDSNNESLDKFLLSNCLKSDPVPDPNIDEIYILASSNGFLLCSFENFYPINYCLVNPVTKEWTPLPEPKIIQEKVRVGFVCKGAYPRLGLVEYTIVKATYSHQQQPSFSTTTTLLLEIFSSGDDQWRQFTCSSSRPFYFLHQHTPVVVRNSDQGGEEDHDGIIVYFLAKLMDADHSVIVVFHLNKGQGLLQMIEAPPEEENSGIRNVHLIAGFHEVIHYVRYTSNTYIELWVLLDSSTGKWFLKHRLSLKKMIEGCLWMDVEQWKTQTRPHIRGLHPMNPNLIFLTLEKNVVCCNFESGTLELACDLRTLDLWYYKIHTYQWPCWPPLL